MSREKQIKRMSYELNMSGKSLDTVNPEECDKIAAILYDAGCRMQSEMYLVKENGDIEPLKKQSGWISVDERLPEREGTYLVYTYKGAIKFGDFRCYYAKNDNPQFDYYVTHWMPLPEAPKGGAE